MVGDPVVDRGDPGGVGVADVADLDRRRPARAGEQPAVAGVPGELDQDVDPVGANAGGERRVVELVDVDPAVGHRPQLVAVRVRPQHRGVADRLDLPPVVGQEQGRDEVGDRMAAQVGREIADAQAPVGVALLRAAGLQAAQRRREALRPGEMLPLQGSGRALRVVVEVEEAVHLQLGSLRRERRHLLERREAGLDPALAGERDAEQVLGVGADQPDRRHGLEQRPDLAEGVPAKARVGEVDLGFGVRRGRARGDAVRRAPATRGSSPSGRRGRGCATSRGARAPARRRGRAPRSPRRGGAATPAARPSSAWPAATSGAARRKRSATARASSSWPASAKARARPSSAWR